MEKNHIHELIPQRPPFVMVDEVLYNDENKTISGFTVLPENVLVDNGRFTEAGLMENIAQTAAARMGYITKTEGIPPQIGYIGAVKNLVVNFKPHVNEKLQTEIEVTSEIMGFTVIEGKVMVNNRIAAQCEMRIFLLKEQ